LLLTLLGAVAGAAAAGSVLLGTVDWEWRSTFTLGGERLHLLLDGVSALFLLPLCVIGGAGAVYAREYWSDRQFPKSAPRGRRWWSALVLAIGWVLVSANGLHFLIGWELFTVAAYFLVSLDRRNRAARQAGWLYLAASHAGTVCLFAFFSTIAARTGSWEIGSDIAAKASIGLAPLFWVALIGFGIKGGVFPLHVWLPSAHANAPSHVSAMLSGVAIKIGMYGLVRFSGWIPMPHGAAWVVTALGCAGAVLGIALALAQDDLKRLLAYCSVENIGVIMIGLGGALLATTHGDAWWGRLALAGALLHVWNHCFFKSLLFLGAGSVLHAAGTREMSRLGGLWRSMPWTASLFAVAAIAISALPPLNGFVSEWLVYLGLIDAVSSRSTVSWAAIPAVVLLGITGALVLATFVKASAIVFLGAPRTKAARTAHESGVWMRAPMIVLALLCATIGLAPLAAWPAISRALATWHPAWTATESPAPLETLSALNVTLAAILVVAVALLVWRVQRNGVRRGLTWDCGYAAPAARMQYTSGSFGGIAASWFSLVLRPARKLRRPRGIFPEHALSLNTQPDPVLAQAVSPLTTLVLQASTAVRRLQHGRLQFYLVYVIAGVAALALLVIFGGKS
jgi:hydrogenase-4 component B